MDEQKSQKDFRAEFTALLAGYRNNEIKNPNNCPLTIELVYRMNQQMVQNGVPMSKAHFLAASQSIMRGDSIVNFTIAENQYVLAGTGKGFAYKAGYIYHQRLNATISFVEKNLDTIHKAFESLKF